MAEGLASADKKAIGADIMAVEFGWPLGLPLCRPLQGGVHEVRTDLTNNRIARSVLRGRPATNGAVAWLHKEDARDPAGRPCPGDQEQEETREGISMSHRAKFDHTGSSFDDFLEAEGIREEVEAAAAIKAVIAADLRRAMLKRKITKSALARQLATSRAHVDRLLDPHYTTVSLETISRAATFMGKRLHFSLRQAAPKITRVAKNKSAVGSKVSLRVKSRADHPPADRGVEKGFVSHGRIKLA